jgi:hypothetical protein
MFLTKQTFYLVVVLLASINLGAQEAGVKLVFGLSQSSFSNTLYTPNETSHAGYQAGFEAILNSGPSYMIASILYQKDNMIAAGNNEYFDHQYSINWVKLRSGVGFQILDMGLLDIQGKVLGAVNAVSAYPQVNNPLPITKLAPADLNLVFGLTVKVGFVFIGAEFEKALTNMVSDDNGGAAKYDTFSFRAGIFF